jgi:hypothetical protein
MKKLASYFVVVIFATQAIVAYAQTLENQGPGFTLTLSMSQARFGLPATYQVLLVKLTNTSKEVMYRTMCDSWGEMYNLEVVYNGIPLEKTEAEKERRKKLEAGDCHSLSGSGSAVAEHTNPGETRQDILYYYTTKPGTYEITATKETFPGHSEKSVTVRSNTITIVVPEPKGDAPQ